MYRYNEGTEYVVNVANVNLIIPTAQTLTIEQQKNSDLVNAHSAYLTFIANGGTVLAQDAPIPSN